MQCLQSLVQSVVPWTYPMPKWKLADYSLHPSERDQTQWQLLWEQCWISLPAKQNQVIEASPHHVHLSKLPLFLLYLAVDHYIKANSVYFVQGPERLTVFILEIPRVSVGIRTVNGMELNGRPGEQRTEEDKRLNLKLYPDVTELFLFTSSRVKVYSGLQWEASLSRLQFHSIKIPTEPP